MPKSTYPTDRFDDLPSASGRVGAHRAENPHLRGGVVFFWAVLATVVLIAVGIFGTLVASGKVTLFPAPSPTPTPTAVVTPIVDPTYSVLVLNATPESGLATQFRDKIVTAGWSVDNVQAGGAGSTAFPTTTVFYALPSDEAAARGLAQVIGGADVVLSTAYQATDDPSTPDDESQAKQLTVVIGLDRTAGTSPAPTP